MTHKTVSRLIDLAKKRAAANSEEAEIKAHPAFGRANYNVKGVEVWSVECMDGDFALYHYGVYLGTTRTEYTPGTNTPYMVFRPSKYTLGGVSVSDQQGINGFLDHLGVARHWRASRAGNTRTYA